MAQGKLDEHVADGLVELRDDAVLLVPLGHLMRNDATAFVAHGVTSSPRRKRPQAPQSEGFARNRAFLRGRPRSL